MTAGILNRSCVIAMLFSSICAPSAIAGEISKAIVEQAYHRFFHEMIKRGFDCVHDFEACRANAEAGKLPAAQLTSAEIDAIKRSFVQQQTPPTIRVVPADAARRAD